MLSEMVGICSGTYIWFSISFHLFHCIFILLTAYWIGAVTSVSIRAALCVKLLNNKYTNRYLHQNYIRAIWNWSAHDTLTARKLVDPEQKVNEFHYVKNAESELIACVPQCKHLIGNERMRKKWTENRIDTWDFYCMHIFFFPVKILHFNAFSQSWMLHKYIWIDCHGKCKLSTRCFAMQPFLSILPTENPFSLLPSTYLALNSTIGRIDRYSNTKISIQTNCLQILNKKYFSSPPHEINAFHRCTVTVIDLSNIFHA